MKPASNTVELWAEEVEKVKFSCPPMTEKQSNLLVAVSLQQSKIDSDKDLLSLVESKKMGLLSAFWLRVKYCHTYKITLSAALFLSEAVILNFGTSTMVANYLQWIAWKYHQPTIDLTFICTTVWPMGFPTQEQWQKLWDMQKLDIAVLTDRKSPYYQSGDNCLDHAEFMESIKTVR